MGMRPGLWLKLMKNSFCPATALHGSVALPFVIPSEAEGSAVLRTIPGNVFRQRNHGAGWIASISPVNRPAPQILLQ
jgi:hypothetical protein